MENIKTLAEINKTTELNNKPNLSNNNGKVIIKLPILTKTHSIIKTWLFIIKYKPPKNKLKDDR